MENNSAINLFSKSYDNNNNNNSLQEKFQRQIKNNVLIIYYGKYIIQEDSNR